MILQVGVRKAAYGAYAPLLTADKLALVIVIITIIIIVVIMACRHIPTMTKSHHGGEMSVMIKVGMCQCQLATIHDLNFNFNSLH